MKRFNLLISMLVIGMVAVFSISFAAETIKLYSVEEDKYIMTETVHKTEAEWRAMLTAEEYSILREEGTERAFTGTYDKHYEHGVYRCAGCGLDLYSSKDKFDSKTGWPSFTAPVARENIATADDSGFFKKYKCFLLFAEPCRCH